MQSNNKIIVISANPASSSGGAEIVWHNLEKKGLDFENLSLKDLPLAYSIFPNQFHLREIFGSRYLIEKSLKKNPSIIFYDKIFGWPKIKPNIKKICYNHGSYTLAGLTFKNKNIFVYLFYKYVISYFEKKSFENASNVIAVSKSVKNDMIRYFKTPRSKIIVINNGVDQKEFKQYYEKNFLRRKYSLPLNKKIILFPGRPSFGKGFDLAKRIIEKLNENYLLVVLAQGKSGLKKIKYLGEFEYRDMPEIYNLSDLTLFPSRYEGFGLCVIESASCGTPTLTSNVGIARSGEFLKEYVCHSVEEYVTKINKLFSNKQAYEKSRLKFIEFSKDYSLDKQLKKINNFIKNETKRS